MVGGGIAIIASSSRVQEDLESLPLVDLVDSRPIVLVLDPELDNTSVLLIVIL